MREIMIKYNPYRLSTTVTIDGKPPKANSRLCLGEKRLQEWIERLPDILLDEFACRDFSLVFHGTTLDFEDVQLMVQQAEKDDIHIKIEYIPAKDHKKKEEAIAKVFDQILQGPFDELRKPDLIDAFKQASSSNFSVNVIATMSAGKSTLINALLGQKLMPSKQTACTAAITTITDNDKNTYTAQAYDADNNLVYSCNPVTLSEMKRLNNNSNVSGIALQGNIPFVTADDTKLILVDTPGPNSARNPEHRAATIRMLEESSKPLVIYVLNGSQLAVNDDDQLLRSVADSMSVGGKQSKDRFLFVVNKMDEFTPSEDNIEETIENVREYLSNIGIDNPNVYPLSAKAALDIRTILKNSDEDDWAFQEASYLVNKITKNSELHMEQYATLTPSEREILKNELTEAQKNNNQLDEALIHSGIRPLELAIKAYVTKYAKTAKIKNTVETFETRLESAGAMEKLKQEIDENEEKRKSICSQIETIKKELSNSNKADELSKKIDNIDLSEQFTKKANELLIDIQSRLTNLYQKKTLTVPEAEEICKKFDKEAQEGQAKFKADIESLIEKNVVSYAKALIEEYNRYLADLAGKINQPKIDPLVLIKGDLSRSSSELIANYTKTTEETHLNEKKRWYKFWTWFQPREYIVSSTTVNIEQLAAEYFAPYQKNLVRNKEKAIQFAQQQIDTLKKDFKQKLEELNKILTEKLEELENYKSNKEEVENRLIDSQKKLDWINDIQNQINEIMEI